MSEEFCIMNPYTPGLAIEEVKKKYQLEKVYKLASNENPLGPSEGLLQVLRSHLTDIHRYPPPLKKTVQSVAQYYQVEPDQVALGNGSSELIDKLLQVYYRDKGVVLISKNSFPLYEICATAHRLTVWKADMEPGWKVSVSSFLSDLKKSENIRLIFISNPNNPTGSALTHQEVETLLQATRSKNIFLVLDEAYREYNRMDDFPDGRVLLNQYSHLILVRSLSKVMGLAGLRAGVLLANPSVIRNLKKALCPFNVNSLANRAIHYCCSDPSFQQHIKKSRELVWNGLDYFYKQLEQLGFVFYPSQANFVLFEAYSNLSTITFEELLKRGVILRPQKSPDLVNYLRMSVGKEEENKQAITALKEVCLFLKTLRKE